MNTEHAIAKMNPRIEEMEVGTRELKTIKIYPLSAGQELETVKIISVLLSSMADSQIENELSDLSVFEMFSDIIRQDFDKIIGYVTDTDPVLTVCDFDNVQLTEFIQILFKANFESIKGDEKKFGTTWEAVKDLFLSQKSFAS